MNYKTIILSCIMLTGMSAHTLYGQGGILERAARRASERLEQKAEERIDRKIDEKIDQSLDSIESSMESEAGETSAKPAAARENASQRRMENLLGSIGISTTPVALEDKYTFDSYVKMNVKSYDKKGKLKSDGDMVTYVANDGNCLGYEFISGEFEANKTGDKKGVFIMDYKNKATIVLSDDAGKRTGIAYGLGDLNEWASGVDDEYEKDESEDTMVLNPKFTKTGRTKTILGYRCEEYLYEDEEGRANIWITNEYRARTHDAYSTIFNTMVLAHGGTGMMLESESVDLKSGEKTVMRVTELDANKKTTFNLGQYEITNLGSIGPKQ
ncbi:DUF4412 domain-containing protein [Alkaliflexus imshenetskii]|uniref:DUF4412 domain-containing protein n=1 Tax=Alkaliflexus imshenetskii TaxID=286730 RepID=UPI0012FA4E79|nr:DUF4412 domain-containing protein [Alkaliflexus imshenetskii]